MTITNEDRFRRAVGDRIKADENIMVGNGATSEFQLRHSNVWDMTLYFNGVSQSSGFTLDGGTGTIAFDTAPADAVEVTVTFKYAAYTQDEISSMVLAYGIDESIIVALEELLANTAKLRDYKEADSEVKNSQVFKNIKDLLAYHVGRAASKSSGVTSARRINDNYQQTKTQAPDLTRLI